MASRALVSALLGGMLTLPSTCNVYRSDIGKLCDAEQLSQGSLKAGRTRLFAWMERAVGSSEGIILVRDLEGKDTHGIGIELRDEARKVGLNACALADQADMQAKDEDYHTDLSNLCSGSALRTDGSVARLDVVTVDDAERLRELVEWARLNARSPDTATVVQKLAAAPPRQRGAVLRAEAGKVGVTTCVMATTLETPPPQMAPLATQQPAPSYTVLKVDALPKNVYPIARAMIAHDAAAAINTCYNTLLLKTPTAKGNVSMKLSFEPTGRVLKAVDEGSQLKGPILACLANAMQSVTTGSPLPEGGKRTSKAGVTLQLAPAEVGTGYDGTIEPGYLEKITPRHK